MSSSLIEIEGLRIEIHGYAYPSADEYWDAEWLLCSASCIAANARVTANGPILMTSELLEFLGQLDRVSALEDDEASLETMEREIGLHVIRSGRLGAVSMTVWIRSLGDHHEMHFSTDLPGVDSLRGQIGSALKEFPVRFAVAGPSPPDMTDGLRR